jgi:FkbM family methyltransferase
MPNSLVDRLVRDSYILGQRATKRADRTYLGRYRMRVPTAQSTVGQLLRLPLKAIPADRPLRILSGRLRGYRWIPGASVHGCWLGTFERYEQEEFARVLRPGQVVFDIGANVGFYTLLAARLVGPAGRVWAFEPAARNVAYLKRHLELNNCRHATVLEVAVADRTGTATFQASPSFSEGRLVADASPTPGQYEVATVTLDALLARDEVSLPNLLKIDVEGAELSVLHGAADVIRRGRPTILLSTHSSALREQCADHLRQLDYDVRPMVDGGGLGSEIYGAPRRSVE